MLTHLHIKNFTLITELKLDVETGLTILTGETGVGKSIILDALTQCLGAKPQTGFIRHGCDSSDISACFDISHNGPAKAWLTDNDFECDNECLLQRTIQSQGRSRCYINGRLIPRQQLHDLGQLLVLIHGQHDQQSLLKRDSQRCLVDDYAKHRKLTDAVKHIYHDWQQVQTQLETLANQKDQSAQQALLQYQVDELTALALEKNEVKLLETEHKQLIHAETLVQDSQHILQLCSDDPEVNIVNLAQRAQKNLQKLVTLDPRLQASYDLFNQVSIYAQEASSELADYVTTIAVNPERLQQVETRLQTIYDLARKHHVNPEELQSHQHTLETQLQQLLDSKGSVEHLQQRLEQLKTDYHSATTKLTKSRQKTAKQLNQAITEHVRQLGMPHAQFEIAFMTYDDAAPRLHGQEQIEFVFTTNPGQQLAPLAKIASGGELSRVSLVIQVLTAQAQALPTLIFDEVDTGIGGSTAAIVGQLLKRLGEQAQVLCVTHLPQVAANANHHWQISKHVKDESTKSQVDVLDKSARIQELARMLGGLEITKQTLAHAKEMLAM